MNKQDFLFLIKPYREVIYNFLIGQSANPRKIEDISSDTLIEYNFHFDSNGGDIHFNFQIYNELATGDILFAFQASIFPYEIEKSLRDSVNEYVLRKGRTLVLPFRYGIDSNESLILNHIGILSDYSIEYFTKLIEELPEFAISIKDELNHKFNLEPFKFSA